MKRRVFLEGGAALAASFIVRPAAARTQSPVLTSLVNTFAMGVPVREARVTLAIAPLVDSGNSVPVTISVDSPMSPSQHVVSIALFNEKNPQRDVAQFTLGPHAGRARVATRIRLATTQKLVAVAKMSDGTCWSHTVDVLVTLAACIEE